MGLRKGSLKMPLKCHFGFAGTRFNFVAAFVLTLQKARKPGFQA